MGVGGRWCKSIEFLCNMSILITFANAFTIFLASSLLQFTSQIQSQMFKMVFGQSDSKSHLQGKGGRTSRPANNRVLVQINDAIICDAFLKRNIMMLLNCSAG